MKRKTAREILTESFRELADSRSIDRITVRDIAENCSYSPATFYRHFRDKYDLIAWDYAQKIAALMDRIGQDGHTWEETLMDSAKLFNEEKDYLKNLFLHTTGHDSFIHYMTDINYSALERYVIRMNGQDAVDRMLRTYMKIYCMGTVNFTCDWIFGNIDLTPDELAEVYKNVVPEVLKKVIG